MGVKNIAIFGGTFDPIHKGHFYAAEIAIKKLSLDKLIFVVAKDQWRKKNIIQATPIQRLDMVNLAIDEEKINTSLLNSKNKFVIESSNIDLKRQGKTYTIDTINEIKLLHGNNHCYFLLIGIDVAEDIHNWKNFNDIDKAVNIVVVNRKMEKDILPNLKEKYNFLTENLLDDISDETSTKQRLGWSNSGLIMNQNGTLQELSNYDSVIQYISKNKLYGYEKKYK
ncbi:MAG: nicotinate-nicotinamide nucleotide adenylyltransferase [Dehalococcoidia bacterium]